VTTKRRRCISKLSSLLWYGSALGLFASCTSPSNVVRISLDTDANTVENSVVINPTNTDNIVGVGMQVGQLQTPSISNFVYSSLDSGQKWSSNEVPVIDGRTQGDDALVFGDSGKLFHSYISFQGLRVENPEDPKNGIFVRVSDDGGSTWESPIPVVDHPNSIEPFEDKPYLTVDRSSSINSKNLYIAWTRFDSYLSDAPEDSSYIYFSRSSDLYRSFSEPIRISDKAGDCMDSDNTVEGAMPVVGIEGAVHVFWASADGLMMDSSFDGGSSFGLDRNIYDTPGGWDISIEGISRHNGMPVARVDHSDKDRRGHIYVSWIDERHGDPDVFLGVSKDNGQTWSDPIRVNSDPISNGKEQFFSWMAVDPIDGSINLVYYRQNSVLPAV